MSAGERAPGAIEVLGHRWAPRVLAELRHGPLGFRALRYRCPWISTSVLSPRLRELQDAGLVDKDDDGRYRLTTAGAALIAALAYEDDRHRVERFVAAWLDARTRADIDGILALYREDARFVSPISRAMADQEVLRGHEDLRAYWASAFERLGPLEFSEPEAIWDSRDRTLVIRYTHGYTGQRLRACEILRLDDRWLVIDGEAMFGVRS
jgi:DNA-binding HxlR family transcriptional regulator